MEHAGVIITAITGLITALFVGYIGVKSLPQIHKAVNTNYVKLEDKLAEALKRIDALNAAALAEAKASSPPPPPIEPGEAIVPEQVIKLELPKEKK